MGWNKKPFYEESFPLDIPVKKFYETKRDEDQTRKWASESEWDNKKYLYLWMWHFAELSEVRTKS